MIVAYVSEHETALRQAVQAAVGDQRVTMRDPARFQAGDADCLDTIVYVAEDASIIRQAYEAFPGCTLVSLSTKPLPGLPKGPRIRRHASSVAAHSGTVDASPGILAEPMTMPAESDV